MRKLLLLFAGAGLLLWPSAAGALSVDVTDRDDNSWGVSSEELVDFNLIDCEEFVDVIFTVTYDSESTSDKELYLYEGTDCDDSPESCQVVGEGQSPSDTTFTIPVDELFEDGCDSSGSTSIWPALLESENESQDDGGDWGTTLSISLDIAGPSTVPQGLSTRIGSGNVRVSWDAVDDDGIAGFIVTYWKGDGSSGTDEVVDAGTDGCAVAGGFEEGDAYDPDLVTGIQDSAIADEDATSATVTGLANGVPYKFAVLAVDDAANPSTFSETVCATPEMTIGFSDEYAADNGKGGGEYCFIATAVFGSYDHPIVRVLRRFRDEFLVKAPGGRSAIAAYYAVGPALAAVVRGHETVRRALEDVLLVFSGAAVCLVELGPARLAIILALCVFAGLVVGLAMPVRRRDPDGKRVGG